ncbi:RsiV family protein [Paenibacillus silviterrae]|uniref:RsiV family protein n=1 Tax=Paenibacillus silviterrae TaxID=3242194 RepID=UPI002543166A|nr:RsiV family protein [Paenibacillus chinjuensis]
MNKELESLKQEYQNIPIPDELDFIVKKAIKQGRKSNGRVRWMTAIAAMVVVMTGLNTSPTLANTLSGIPVVGSLVKVLTFKQFQVDEENAQATIQVPAITNLDNSTLEASLNNKYLEEGKKLYDEFMVELEKLKQNGGGHVGLSNGYVVKTDNEHILSIGRFVVNTVGSSSTKFKYDSIDKKKQILITLPSLFKDDRYIQVISENIKEQMKQQMKADPKKVYWVEGVPNQVNSYFTTITREQSFYINNEGKLVVSFDKYDVAPGYMGVVEFIIPTTALADVLVSDEYIKN